MGCGQTLRDRRCHPYREDYGNAIARPKPLRLHREFINDRIHFDELSFLNCNVLEGIYVDWLGDNPEHGTSTNTTDKNFLYEEIEIMSAGIAEWTEEGIFRGVRRIAVQ